jgi:hypothetical protein
MAASKVERGCDPFWARLPPSLGKPLVYQDPATSVLLYGESDGHHLAAITHDGRLLWVTDAFVQGHLCPYRTKRPVIYKLEAVTESDEQQLIELWNQRNPTMKKGKDPLIQVTFNSSQWEFVDLKDGSFIPGGQN